MKSAKVNLILSSMLLAAMALPASAGVEYTQVNVSIPLNSYYNIGLNHDGSVQFTIRSAFLQSSCNTGDEYLWFLNVIPATGAAVVTARTPAFDYALPLPGGVVVGPDANFSSGTATMAELFWGACGSGTEGTWLGLPDRYLGLRFTDAAKQIHYGWAKVSTAAYVDQSGVLHTLTFLAAFAYQTLPQQPILTGQTSD
jgi:hypothetical protein